MVPQYPQRVALNTKTIFQHFVHMQRYKPHLNSFYRVPLSLQPLPQSNQLWISALQNYIILVSFPQHVLQLISGIEWLSYLHFYLYLIYLAIYKILKNDCESFLENFLRQPHSYETDLHICNSDNLEPLILIFPMYKETI